MHQIVLLTAMTATTGLFGGGRHAKSGHCGHAARGQNVVASASCQAPMAYATPVSQCGTQLPYSAPAYPAPTAQAPAPTPQVAPAPQAAYYSYNAYYYPTTPSCAGGNCYRR